MGLGVGGFVDVVGSGFVGAVFTAVGIFVGTVFVVGVGGVEAAGAADVVTVGGEATVVAVVGVETAAAGEDAGGGGVDATPPVPELGGRNVVTRTIATMTDRTTAPPT